MNKELLIDFNAPLNKQDNENQTYGCRQKNPDICKYNGIPEICAFCTEDNVCKKPSRKWKENYNKLKMGENNE